MIGAEADTAMRTPREDGFAMPAEWATHAACWLLWPERPDNWRLGAKPAQAAFTAVAAAIAAFEPVRMGVSDRQWENARARLPAGVRLCELSADDAWMRDVGPTVVCHADGRRRAVHWQFNAWGGLAGGLYFPWDRDARVAPKVAEFEGMPWQQAPLVLEGGSFHVDGEGTCLVTEECLLNPNRNPQLDRPAIEALLRAYLGVECILWLGRGVPGDETDGHVDNLCCFLGPALVALAWTDDPAHPLHPVARDAAARLAAARDARGRRIEVLRLQVPSRPLFVTPEEAEGIDRSAHARARPAGLPLPASYVNFLFVNGGIVLPTFDDPGDDAARAALAAAMPDRRIVTVPGREILLGGGNVHCITQQIPAGHGAAAPLPGTAP